MNATWNLETTEYGTRMTYRNLATGQTHSCGETYMKPGDLLEWMLCEGGVGPEVVFLDGGLYGVLLTEVNDRPPFYDILDEGRA